MKLIQCVPNFSEGCRTEVIGAIRGAMESAGTAKLIDCSWDCDHNRCVITMLGEPEAIRDAVIAGAAVAIKLIDLREHKGEHPRIGAIDVVPLTPVLNCTMEDCVALSYEIGRELAERFELPVYFYEQSARSERRKNLAIVRRGGFELLRESPLIGERAPDMGPNAAHPTAGATVVGARGPLIAYNVNLGTQDIAPAQEIAAKIRQIRDEGLGFVGVKALAINLRSRRLTQVSTNITRPECVSIYEVYKFVEKEAEAMGVEVAGSELIGAMREDAMIASFCNSIKLPLIPTSRILDTWIRSNLS